MPRSGKDRLSNTSEGSELHNWSRRTYVNPTPTSVSPRVFSMFCASQNSKCTIPSRPSQLKLTGFVEDGVVLLVLSRVGSEELFQQ